MTERFASDLTFILFVLLIAAAIGFFFGYYLRKAMKCKKCIELEKENEAHKHTIQKLEEEIVAQRFRFEKLLANDNKFDAVKAKTVMGVPVKNDDLEIIEGIGPKISEILRLKGIGSWKALSLSSPLEISEFLVEEGGEQYRLHNPATWPEQAKLAYDGEWEELKALQDKLMGGRE